MFTTVTESADVDPQSRYGEPQYEEGVDTDWESGYYGGSNSDRSPTPVEFVTGIEYRIGDESASLPSPRRAQSLSASD